MKGSRHIKSVILRIKNVEKWLFSTSFIQKLVSTRTKTSVVYFLQLISSLVGWWSKPGDRLLLPYSLAFKLPISLGSSANCIARKWSAELAREKKGNKGQVVHSNFTSITTWASQHCPRRVIEVPGNQHHADKMVLLSMQMLAIQDRDYRVSRVGHDTSGPIFWLPLYSLFGNYLYVDCLHPWVKW